MVSLQRQKNQSVEVTVIVGSFKVFFFLGVLVLYDLKLKFCNFTVCRYLLMMVGVIASLILESFILKLIFSSGYGGFSLLMDLQI